MRFHDEDTGESSMDVVPVPEGISIQTYFDDHDNYISVILRAGSIDELITFLQEHRFGAKK